MRRPGLAAVLLILLATAAAADVTFVSPLAGAQVIGPMAIEVQTATPGVDRVDFHVDGVLAGVARTPPYRIAFDFGTSLDARRISARVWSNGFRSSEEATMTTAALTANDTMTVDVVEVPLRARSSRTLTPADLVVRENGVEQRVRDVKRERPPAHFAFIVDRSLSMGGGKLDAALAAIRAGLPQLRPGDTASLLFFNHNLARPRAITRAAEVQSDLAPSGGTSLRDALASIASPDRTYAIVVTDGGDRNSVLSEEEALRRISGTRTVVHAIVVGDSHARFLDRAAANTGGAVVAATRHTVARELARVLSDINSRYLVVYQSQGTDRGWRSIDVRARRRGVEVLSARKGYFAQ